MTGGSLYFVATRSLVCLSLSLHLQSPYSHTYRLIKPLRAGELSLVVTINQEDYALGSACVSTLAAEQATPPAGKV
jgi:hypothetical protein